MAEIERLTSGELTLTTIVEMEPRGIPPHFFYPEATADDITSVGWLDETQARPDGTIAMRVQSFVIDLPDITVLVDPCVGNGKRRDGIPFWDDLSTPWLDDLGAAGHEPADIDVVVHTHLHEDHIGWDTHLVDGVWVPTFPNARHLYVDVELAHWHAEHERQHREAWVDSVQPILDAGLAEEVSADADLGHGLRLVSTPGHTPGHVSLDISAGAEPITITGDLVHHPMQLARPDIAEVADHDADLARRTRSDFFDHHARHGTLLAATHFPGNPMGRAERDGPAWRFVTGA